MEHAFAEFYGRPPRWVAHAPGRVNLIGEHTDYNGGFVLPMAIERYTRIAAALNGSARVTLRSTATDETVHIDLRHPIEAGPKGRWENYPKGVLAGFVAAGHAVPGFDALIHSDVPPGGGLSSSAALEVALATLLEAVAGERLDPVDKALLCHTAEHDYAQVPCGIMDQFICTLAREDHLLLLDCRSRQPRWIEFSDPAVSILIFRTHLKHALANGEYASRRRQCDSAAEILSVPSLREATVDRLEMFRERMEPVIFRRARHVLSEIGRTLDVAEKIRARDWRGAGQLMFASHESLQKDFEVSCPELDAVVQSARRIGPQGGVFGCRMTGGGFGGCAVALVERRAEASITRAVSSDYRDFTGHELAVFATRAVGGARLAADAS